MVDANTVTALQRTNIADSQQNIDLLLDLLFAHNLQFMQSFLAQRKLVYSPYSKPELQVKMKEYYVSGKLTFDELVTLLNEIEGWGDQHVYLYKSTPELSAKWRQEERARSYVIHAGHESVFGTSLPLLIPSTQRLAAVEWSQERVRFVWIEPQIWQQRDEELEAKLESTLSAAALQVAGEPVDFRIYRTKTSRGLIAFEWDLVSGEAAMLIHRLPRGYTYSEVRTRVESVLQQMVDIDAFERMRVARAVRRLEQSTEVRRHQMKYQSDHQGVLTVTSGNHTKDVFVDDPVMERARKALEEDALGLAGRFYWQPSEGKLSREVYTVIYGTNSDHHRIAIFAEHNRDDVRHVLSRIRFYCSEVSSSRVADQTA